MKFLVNCPVCNIKHHTRMKIHTSCLSFSSRVAAKASLISFQLFVFSTSRRTREHCMENGARFSQILTSVPATSVNLEIISENIFRQTFPNNVQDGSMFWMKCTNCLRTRKIHNDLSSLKFCSQCVCTLFIEVVRVSLILSPSSTEIYLLEVVFVLLLGPSSGLFPPTLAVYFFRKTFFLLLEDPLRDSSYDDISDASSLLDLSEKSLLLPSQLLLISPLSESE